MGAIKRQGPSERWTNLYRNRLSDGNIQGLFDEYGLKNRLKTPGDFNWVRENMPNSPDEIRKILKIELDKINRARKEALKNNKNNMSQSTQMPPATPSAPPVASTGPIDGQGGQGGPGAALTLENLLNDSRVKQDKGVNNVTMAQWLQGNASLIPLLAQLGYKIEDLVNEAYSQTRYNRSAFQGDMTTTQRSQNVPYSSGESPGTGTPSSSPTSGALSTTPLGPSGVNHLFQLYLGRNAKQEELNAWSNKSDAELRPVLMGQASGSSPGSSLPPATGAVTDFSPSSNASIVKFSSDPDGELPGDASTIWWVDHDTKTFRPIVSMQALRDLYLAGPEGEAAYQEALNSMSVLDPSELSTGQLANYMDLGWEYRIKEGRQAKALDFNPISLQNSYGKPYNEAMEKSAISALNSWLKFLKLYGSDVDGIEGIRLDFFDSIRNDPPVIALYIHALANGNYTPNDIYMDIKRRQLVDEGREDLAGITIIHPNITKDQYMNTNNGMHAFSLEELFSPSNIGNISAEVWNSPLAHLSDEFFMLIDPERYDPNSPEWQEALNAIKLDMYDYIYEALKNELNSDKIMHDEKWREFVEEIERKYGYRLSDNAMEAWRQIEEITGRAAETGLMASGLTEEQHQKTLKHYREENRRLRETKSAEFKSAEADRMRLSASPDEIHAMNLEDQAAGLPREEWRAYKWGLVPKEEQNWDKFLADYRERFPESQLSDDQVKSHFYDQMYDQYGNFRSKLYQNYQDNISMQKYGFVLSQGAGTSEMDERRFRHMQAMLDEEAALQKDPSEPFGSQSEDMIDYGDKGAKELEDLLSGQAGVAADSATASGVAPHKATLASPDGKHRTAVNANSPEASALLGAGWKLWKTGDPGDAPINLENVWNLYNITPPSQTGTTGQVWTAPTQASPATQPVTTPGQTPSGSTGQKATLHGPNGQKEVVDVGSARASQLQSQGWGLTAGSYKAPTTF